MRARRAKVYHVTARDARAARVARHQAMGKHTIPAPAATASAIARCRNAARRDHRPSALVVYGMLARSVRPDLLTAHSHDVC